MGWDAGGAETSHDRSSLGLLTKSVGLKSGFLVDCTALTLSSYCLVMVALIVLAAGVSMVSALLLVGSDILGGVTKELSENEEESEELMVVSVSESEVSVSVSVLLSVVMLSVVGLSQLCSVCVRVGVCVSVCRSVCLWIDLNPLASCRVLVTPFVCRGRCCAVKADTACSRIPLFSELDLGILMLPFGFRFGLKVVEISVIIEPSGVA